MSRKGSWDDDGSSLSESLLRFVHGGDEANPPTPRSVTQALALTPATRERRNSDLDELTFYYSPEEPGVRGEVRVGLDRSVDRYDEDDDDDALVNGGGASFASWRDVPRRLEEVEGNVEDVRRRLLALELHGRRRAREDSANVAVGLPGPRMRACLQTASLTCLRLNRTIDWNLAPPPSPPASTYSQTYSRAYSQTYSRHRTPTRKRTRPRRRRPFPAQPWPTRRRSSRCSPAGSRSTSSPTIPRRRTSPAVRVTPRITRRGPYERGSIACSRRCRPTLNPTNRGSPRRRPTAGARPDRRRDTFREASRRRPGPRNRSAAATRRTTTKRGKERARRLLHRSGRRAIVVDFGDRARAADDATAA